MSSRIDNPLNLSEEELRIAGVDVSVFRTAVEASSTGDDLGTLNVLKDPLWSRRVSLTDRLYASIDNKDFGPKTKRLVSQINKVDSKISERNRAVNSGEVAAALIYSRVINSKIDKD